MNRTSRPRMTSKLPESTSRRLDSYALAAAAVGVSVLALAPASQAKVIYKATHHVIKEGGHYNLDLNQDGLTDFTFQARYTRTSSGFYAFLSAVPAKGNGVDGWTGFQAWDFALKAGANIGPRQYFPGKVLVFVDSLAGSDTTSGSWANVSNRYLGLKLKIDGKTHYGWARMSVQVQGSSIVGTLTGYAYETVPVKAIKAGQKNDSSGGITGPRTLGHLAKGAAAIPNTSGNSPESAPAAKLN